MKKKILYIQPPLTNESLKHFENEILIAPVYLHNFLRENIQKLQFELMYLPLELKNGGISLKSSEDIIKFYSLLDDLTNNLNFELSKDSIILISGTTTSHFLISKIIAEYYNKYYKSSLILYGGAAASACPNDFNYNGSPIDFQIQGEGEISLLNLLKQNPKKQNIPQVIKPHPIDDLNKLPPIDFGPIFDKYIKRFNHLSINLSRGCPYSCEFCQEKNLFKDLKGIKRWRAYTPQRAILELKRMVNYGLINDINEFGLYDSVFALSVEWLKKFLDVFQFEGINSIFTETRIDILNKKMIQKMKNKKLFLWMGIEHFSPRLLKLMNKTPSPKNYLKKIFDMFDLFKSLDYKFSINLIANYPGTTLDDEMILYNNLENLIENGKIDITSLSLKKFHIFPGNSLYDSFIFNGKNTFYIPQHNSIAYFPKWWRNKDTLKNGLFCVRPSQKLSLRKSLGLYYSQHRRLLKIALQKLKEERSPDFLTKAIIIKKQIEYLDNNKNELFEFLNTNNIELNEHSD